MTSLITSEIRSSFEFTHPMDLSSSDEGPNIPAGTSSSLQSLASETTATLETSAPQKRSYLQCKAPGLTIAPSSPHLWMRILELKQLLEELGEWDRLGATMVVQDKIPNLIFPEDKREHLNSLSRLPKLAPYLRNDNSRPCFYRVGSCAISSKGLVETPKSVERYVAQIQALEKEADAALNKKRMLKPVECELNLENLGSSETALLVELFHSKGMEGLCIGENHGELNSIKFLFDNMFAMNALGVDTLFLENIPYDFLQPYLSHHFALLKK